jgi:hypothetical protein
MKKCGKKAKLEAGTTKKLENLLETRLPEKRKTSSATDPETSSRYPPHGSQEFGQTATVSASHEHSNQIHDGGGKQQRD